MFIYSVTIFGIFIIIFGSFVGICSDFVIIFGPKFMRFCHFLIDVCGGITIIRNSLSNVNITPPTRFLMLKSSKTTSSTPHAGEIPAKSLPVGI